MAETADLAVSHSRYLAIWCGRACRVNLINEPGSPASKGGQWVTEEVAASALSPLFYAWSAT